MFGIGVTELGIILVVALLVFGPKRLPELARTLGRGMGEFRRASSELRQSLSLDDLQSDLRRDLTQSDTIHKPTAAPTRPAQAGADEPPATSGNTSSGDTSDTSDTPDSPDTSDSPGAGTPDPPAAEAQSHPGELPLGNDHEHHHQSEDQSEDQPEHESSEGASPEERTKTATPAHAGLGNVPASDADPTDPERG